jgi:sulfoxide reductase heme-binding subunit YedZ
VTSNQKNILVIFGVAAPVAAAAITYLMAEGYRTETLDIVLRVTGRMSCAIFMVVFAARPLRQLMAHPWTRALARGRRSGGLTFAAVHTVHLAFIFYGITTATLGATLNPVVLAIGGTAYLLMFLMVITSFDAPTRFIGPAAWRRLHKTGLYYNAFLFLGMLAPGSDEELLEPGRVVLIVMTALAVTIRVAAFIKTRSRKAAAGRGA